MVLPSVTTGTLDGTAVEPVDIGSARCSSLFTRSEYGYRGSVISVLSSSRSVVLVRSLPLTRPAFSRLQSSYWREAKPDAFVTWADDASDMALEEAPSGVTDGSGTCPAGAAPEDGTGALIA